MIPPNDSDYTLFRDAVQGLRRGDFSRLDPLFDEGGQIVEWVRKGLFGDEPEAALDWMKKPGKRFSTALL